MQENILTPDLGRIKDHLVKLFSGYDQYSDGLIEIAYTPQDTGAVNRARLFNLDEIHDAAKFAHEVNSTQGVNVYVGAALRLPDADKHKRTNIHDFYACNVVWADLDDEGATDGIKEKYKALPPYHVVVTGKHPHTRAQLWWKIDDIKTKPIEIEPVLASLCSHFKGDLAVVDPIRVMRLGGTVAWPKKDGRIPELTISATPALNTPICSIDRLQSYFPAPVPLLTNTGVGGVGHDGKPRHVITGKLKIDELLQLTKQQGKWHHNMRDAVASMVSSGWSDDQIKIACAPYCDKGKNDPDLLPLIATGRKKWNVPEPELNILPEQYDATTGEIKEKEVTPLTATSINDIDLDNIPVREFLFGDLVGRKYVSLLVAPPGAGKSILTMQIGIYGACGKKWGNFECKKPLNVWIYNNEEGFDEIKRRIKACMIEALVAKSDLKGQLYVDSGENRSINLANIVNNAVVSTADFQALKDEVINRKIDLLIIDPFAETHSVAESNNDQIKVVAALYREIAIQANCAVLLVHHTKKYTAGDEENAGNIDNARGGGAQIGVVRRAFTLSTMTKTEAKKIGVPEENRRWFVRFDDAKSNITAPVDRTTWFKFQSIDIANGKGINKSGDSVGVLTHTNIELIQEEFGDIVENRSVYILTLLCELFEKSDGKNEFSTTEFISYVKEYSSLGFSDRTIREDTKEAIMNKELSNGFLHMGNKYKITIPEKRGQKNSYVIKIVSIDGDFS